MSKVTIDTAWSTILKPYSLSISINKGRGIFLGWTRDGRYIRVVTKPNATYSTFAPEFWLVDDGYMNGREQIAELRGRIAESNEPTDIRDYENEVDKITRELLEAD